MAESAAQVETQDSDIKIDFPFLLTIQHAPIGIRQMFELAELLDFHELRFQDPARRARFGLIVDLESQEAEVTCIQVQPREPVTYSTLATSVEMLLDEFQNLLGSARITRLQWLVPTKGVSSDARASHQRVR